MTQKLTPEFLDRACCELRDDSLTSLLQASPKISLSSKSEGEEKTNEQLCEAAFAWAMRPTQENANLVAGRYIDLAKGHGRKAELEFLSAMSMHIAVEGKGLLWNVIMIPLVLSQDSVVKASAALDLCVLHPKLRGEEYAGPRFVAGIALNDKAAFDLRVAAIAGALHLGDLRLNSLTLEIWRLAPDDVRYQASQIKPGTLTLGFLEFLLAALVVEPKEGIYGNLAALIAYYAQRAQTGIPLVIIERHLPAWEGESNPFRRRETLSFDDVRNRIAHQLQHLCKNEKGDKVMPVVLDLWRVSIMNEKAEFGTNKSRFVRFKDEREVDVALLENDFFTTYFATGIVNPMGPTLNAVVVRGFGPSNETQEILRIMLNPFSQTCHVIGELASGEDWEPLQDLRPFFDLPSGSCPTFLMPSALYSTEVAESLFAELLAKFHDGSRPLSFLRKYPGDPWARVQREMSGTTGLFDSMKRKLVGDAKPRALTPIEAREFVQIQLQPKNLHAEFQAFMYAWKGSIDFTGMSKNAMSQDRFTKMFSRLAICARLPFMRNFIDNPEMLES